MKEKNLNDLIKEMVEEKLGKDSGVPIMKVEMVFSLNPNGLEVEGGVRETVGYSKLKKASSMSSEEYKERISKISDKHTQKMAEEINEVLKDLLKQVDDKKLKSVYANFYKNNGMDNVDEIMEKIRDCDGDCDNCDMDDDIESGIQH